MELIDQFNVERECYYKEEHYRVRDNGAVFRLKKGSRKSSLDEKWTFGKKDSKTGYMTIGSSRVHIIVAIAFHGEQDTKKLVVDHLDNNRCNNRPENLKWCTRLENSLNNPVTLKKLLFLYDGDIQAFIDNPASIREKSFGSTDVDWMCTVTPEEAKAAYENVMAWAAQPVSSSHSEHTGSMAGLYFKELSVEDQVKLNSWTSVINSNRREPYRPKYTSYTPVKEQEETEEQEPFLALSPASATSIFKTPTTFPLCPESVSETPLEDYLKNIRKGEVISSNKYTIAVVEEFALCKNKIFAVCKNVSEEASKDYCSLEISMDKGKFLHRGRTYLEKEGALYDFTIAQGKKWEGELPKDYFC